MDGKWIFGWGKMTFIVSAYFSYASTWIHFSTVKLIIVMKLSASNVIWWPFIYKYTCFNVWYNLLNYGKIQFPTSSLAAEYHQLRRQWMQTTFQVFPLKLHSMNAKRFIFQQTTRLLSHLLRTDKIEVVSVRELDDE